MTKPEDFTPETHEQDGPEKEAPTIFRAAMDEDPKLEGMVMLMLDSIMPALQHGRDYGSKAYPDDAEYATWTNGAIFGVVAQFITDHHDGAGVEEITKVYACVSDVISKTLDTYGCFDLEQYSQDFLVRVGAEKMD